MPIRAVLDTNILVSGLLAQLGASHAIIERLRSDAFVLVLSAESHDEYEAVFARPFVADRSGYSVSEVNAYLRGVEAKAEMIGHVDPAPVEVRDVNDNPVLATAMLGTAAFLVTGDQDLLTLNGNPALGALRILPPRDFLVMLDSESNGASSR